MSNFEQIPQSETQQEAWDKQQEAMEKMCQEGAGKFLEGLDNIDQAFETEKKCVCCMDEGTAHYEYPGQVRAGRVRHPLSGCILGGEISESRQFAD